MPYRYVLLLLLLRSAMLSAQDSAQVRLPRLIVKLAPLSLFDKEATFQIGAEVFLNRRVSIQPELGYGLPWMPQGVRDNSLDNRHVWRYRTEVRLYARRRKGKPLPLMMERSVRMHYVALDFFGITTNGLIDGIVTNAPLFDPRQEYRSQAPLHKQVFGLHVKSGAQWLVRLRPGGPKNLVVDMFFGAGVRYRRVWIEPPPDVQFSIPLGGMGAIYNPSAGGIAPSIAAGIKVGYVLF